jgi:uncharacterized repeat protein (TIGR03803 family)
MRVPIWATVAALAVGSAAAAAPPTTLFRFPHASGGQEPFAPVLVLAGGSLVGTTLAGGNGGCNALEAPSGCGVVFALLPGPGPGVWTESVLHVFRPDHGDGAEPDAGLIADPSGNLYGTTASGGLCSPHRRGCGTVFELSPPAHGRTNWSETVLHTFTGADGDSPQASLTRDAAGNLYGTTYGGGTHHQGTVFRLTPTGSPGIYTETVLASLTGANAKPLAPVIFGADGALYGTSSADSGAVFRLAPQGGGVTTIYTFPNTTFVDYVAGLSVDAAGNLYGTTSYGGQNAACADTTYGCGRVFRLAPPAAGGAAWTETDLHLFTGTANDGSSPFSGVLIGAGGTLTGNTANGGNAPGTVFQLKPQQDGSYRATILARFVGPAHGGSFPQAALAVDASGVFYGTTPGSGSPFPPNGAVYSVGP